MLRAEGSATFALPIIELAATPSGVSVQGKVIGLESASVDAELTVFREDNSGRMSYRQSRSLDITTGSVHVVATMDVSAAPGAELEVLLELSADGNVFARSETRLGDLPEN
jgi:hypothetical protein